MPQQPTAPRPGHTARSATPDPEPGAPQQQQQKASDLTVTKVIAAAGAAATSAVVGSYLGAAGTVAGAAIGSVALTLSSTIYQRSLDRTRETIVARIKLTPDRRVDLSDTPTVRLEVPEPRVSPEAATTQLRVEPALRRPRRTWIWAGATVLAFVLGLLVVTGLEWAKGSSLTTGQEGTSVGRVLAPAPAADAPQEESDAADEGSAGSDSEDRDGAATDATPTEEPRSDTDSTDEATPSAEPTEDATSSEEPEPSAPARESRTTDEPLPTAEVRVPAPAND